ncbi:MAG TPA: hypothetical protein VF629_20150 [Hymenobacter sp.]|jgi:hypothetical protein|uniref:hypothetical protein n=1 Tax=Hymenobacter sp. TaxID=1898978 RepID=UPI002ED7A697
MRHLFALHTFARLGLAATFGLSACNGQEEVAPDEPCATTATVRFCYGLTTMCPTQHTTLELSDGTRIRPTGKVWEAYLPKQVDGQVLRVSYEPASKPTSGENNVNYVSLSCLEQQVLRCGNE